MPECLLCNKNFKKITESHLKKAHNMSCAEYLHRFPNAYLTELESEETRRKKSEGKIGKKHSEAARQKMSESKKGQRPWNAGLSGITNEKLSQTLKEKFKDKEKRPKASEFIGPKQKKQRAKQSEETKAKRGKSVSGDANGARIKSRQRIQELCIEQKLEVEFLENGSYGLTCLECDSRFTRTKSVLTPYAVENNAFGDKLCPGCYPRSYNVSKKEIELREFISSIYVGLIQTSIRTIIPPYEIDIFIPEFKLAIELDGIYWHSEQVTNDKLKSFKKHKLAEANGVRLLTIFEDEWDHKKDIVKARLMHIIGKKESRTIFARKCELKHIDSSSKNDFLLAYHIQGTDRASKAIGAFYDDELLAVMTFSKSSFSKGGDGSTTELNRFATKAGVHIPGIASKLLAFYRREFNPAEIISYSDSRWSDGNVYVQLGFKQAGESPPSYFYFKQGHCQRMHRSNFMKHMLSEKLDQFDPSLTEYENMLANGYDRIWDCGTKKWVMK